MQQEQIFISNPFSNVLGLAERELIFFTGAVLWIYAEDSVDNTGMFSLLLISVCTQPGLFLLLSHPTDEENEGAQSGGDAADPRDPADNLVSRSAYEVEGKEKQCCLSYQLATGVLEPCFPWDSWAPACLWEALNEFLTLLYLHAQLLFYLLNCLYFNPRVLSLLLFWFSPPIPGE